mgnify:FL=1|tara:strand:- start:33534 stop:34313 length:780 start_codon:yes stop_codon:yes gene_type:complete
MISADTLKDLAGIRHVFFSRDGGVSDGIYASLNCGPGSNDARDAVIDNRARAMAVLDVEPDALVTVHQIHSPTCVQVETSWALAEAPKADAMVTSQPGIALGILTADCAPVLFADADAGVIGAAHAGWKGALGGVLESTLETMTDEGARLGRIACAVGPCIAQSSYEVGAEFRTAFMEASIANVRFFQNGAQGGKFQFDLGGYVAERLRSAGVGSVEVLGLDTYADADRFFSYRRSTHKGEPDYGRLLSTIMLSKDTFA